MSVELGNAYISVSVETKKIPAQLRGALNSGAAGGVAAGSTAGANFASGLKKAIAAAGIAKVFTSAVTAGLNRLNTLEKADIQFRNMGLSAAQTKKQLADLNDIVTGTSTSLDDAAGTAAMLGQAGVKSGADLNNAVKALVNLSAASGTSAKDIGLVMMQIKASGKLMGSEALQLAQRGVPIYDLVAKSIGKTTAEVRKMGEAGKISFEQVVKAINDGTGNLAKEMGATIPAQFANLKTALAKASAEGLKPFFEDGKQGIGGLTDLIKRATPTIGKLSAALHDKIFDDWGPKIKAAFDAVRSSGLAGDTLDAFREKFAIFKDMLPALESIAGSLFKAGSALGVGAWSTFNLTLQASNAILRVLAPLLETVADFMERQPGLVTAAATAWLLFKTVPNLLGRVSAETQRLRTQTTNLTTALRAAAVANNGTINTARMGTVTMGRFGSAIQQLGTSTPVIARMQQSFMNTATSASHFGRTLGTVTAVGTGFKAGLGGIMGALGGPAGLGITAALAAASWALGNYQKKQQDAAQAAATHKARVDSLIESMNAYTGAIDENGRAQIVKNLREDGKLDALRYNQGKGMAVTTKQFTDAAMGNNGEILHFRDEASKMVLGSLREDMSNVLRASKEKTGMSNDEIVQAFMGNQELIERFESGYGQKIDSLKKGLSEAARNALDLNEAIGKTNDQLKEAQKYAKMTDQAMGGLAKRIPAIANSLKGLSKGESIKIDTKQIQGAEGMLERLGFKVQDLGDGQVKVTAKTDDATAKLDFVRRNVGLMNLLVANPKIGMNTQVFEAKDAAARAKLQNLRNTTADPKVTAVIDDLLAGHKISMDRLAELNGTTAKPLVDLLVEKALANAKVVSDALDKAAKPRHVTITVSKSPVLEQLGVEQDMFGNPVLPRADGAIVDSFANGGLKQIEKPNRADIFAGRGAGTIFAEKETGGEAYIPLAESKRRRSTDILATVANMFGLALVPQNSISATFGDWASRAVSGLFKKAGSDNITRYADGGIALKQLAEGNGASRPLTGAPYVWGGVHWGDCSGAMSAFARFAVGLDPFGGRFATANEGDYLAKLGFKPGRGTTGDLRFGWVNGGPGGGHTAGTLPDGTNIEMGGSYGGGKLGGTVGSDDGQFTDHAYLTIGPDWNFASQGTDDGGYVNRGTSGNYPNESFTGSTSGNTTISGRFGAAAGAFVEGQLADIFKTLYVNDTPGVLGAIAEYENSQRNGKSPSSPGDTAASKREYEEAKLKAKQDFEAEKLKRKQEYDSERARLKAELDAKKLSRAEYDAKIAELKKKFDDTELQKKQEYDKKTLEAKQKYDELQRTQRGMGDNTTAPKPPSDPGSTAPKPGHDTGGASDDPKSAVKRAFNPAGWDEGQFWSDTDWIVGKESGWNPKAQNPSSTAYGLFQFLDETWATVGASKTDDPFKQGEAGLKYIQQRYGDPSKARAFWEANGWYDKGGIAEGAGFMAKGTLKPERILDPQQTRAFDRMVDANFEPNSPELASVGGDEFNFYITGADANEIASKVERKMRFNSMKSRGRPL